MDAMAPVSLRFISSGNGEYISLSEGRFDVADGDLLIIRSQGTGKGRRRITVNEDQIRLFFGQDVLEAQERLRRNIVQGLALAMMSRS